MLSLQSRTGPVQGQDRVFPVYFSHTGKNLFTLAGIPVMKTGFSLLGKVHRENPVFITGMGLQCTLKSMIKSIPYTRLVIFRHFHYKIPTQAQFSTEI